MTEQAIEKAKAALVEHAEHAAGLQRATDELTQASYKIAETLYKHKSAEGNTQEAPKGTDENPIEAEINE